MRTASIRPFLALVVHLNLELFQMDVKTAFLNGSLEEEIYMDQLVSFASNGREDKVCRLKRSIYGLSSVPDHGISDSTKLLFLLA